MRCSLTIGEADENFYYFNEAMHILLSSDSNYIMPSCVMMKSVSLNNADEDIVFHIQIDSSVGDRHIRQLRNAIATPRHTIECHQMDRWAFHEYPKIGVVKTYLSKTAYYRLLAADVLSQDIHKVLYLDGDIIVRKSLHALWNIDMDGKAVAAVTDMAEAKQDFSRLSYPRHLGYFNSGVLLINVDYWREHHLKEKFLDLITNHPEQIVLHDQDVLNITLHDQKLCLPMKYNVQNGFLWKKDFNQLGDRYEEYEADLLEAIADPVIIHFTDSKKPWHVEDCNPYSYEFMKYYKQTEWKYQPLTHCNKSKIRYFAAKFLRKLGAIPQARTDEAKYYSLDKLQSLVKNRL